MQLATHIMAGWCTANLLPNLTPRQRLFCMIAAAVPDLDAVTRLAGEDAFLIWHHRATHNLPFGIFACLALTFLSRPSFGMFILYLAEFHLHLVMDVFGSGPGWGISYYWPFSNWQFDNRPYSWEFFSWQNISFAAGFLVWTILIAIRKKRTPLEVIMPSLDAKLLRKREKAVDSVNANVIP